MGKRPDWQLDELFFNDSDIYIFYDPLSSLDAYVGMNLFNEAINDYLKEKTVIISIHALQYVSNFDKVFYIHQGVIKFEGGPDEVEQEKFYIEFKSIERNKTQVESDINKEKEEIEKKYDKNLKNILDIKNNNNDKKD
jgi:ABC-type multidrug transport system ATPase subunit